MCKYVQHLKDIIMKSLDPLRAKKTLMKSLDPLRAKKIFKRKKMGHTAVSAIKASSVTL